MAEFVLDANHISPLVVLGHPLRAKVLKRLNDGDTFSIVVPALHEFLYGIALLPRAKQNWAIWQSLEGFFTYYAVDEIVAKQSAQLRVKLRTQGWQLDGIDSMIAVVVMQKDVTLLTTDKDFRGIPNFPYQNWRENKA